MVAIIMAPMDNVYNMQRPEEAPYGSCKISQSALWHRERTSRFLESISGIH